MPETMLFMINQLFRVYTVGLCLGVSTIAMTFYFYVVAKGRTEAGQGVLMQVVYRVLRVGMVLVMVSELTALLYNMQIGNSAYWTQNPELAMRLTVFAVICCNALAMQHKKISMWLGPVLAGGSWYCYFFLSVWQQTGSSYLNLVFGYLSWLIGVFIFLTLFRLYLTRHQQSRIGDGATVNTAK